MTLQELADRLEVDRSTVFRYEKGDTAKLFQKNAHRLAEVLGVESPEALLASGPDQVQLVGNVGAGAEVFPIDEENEWLEAPPGIVDPLAVRVVGRSMLPVYRPGDILFAERRERAADDVVGRDCIVQVSNGPRLVKRVQAGASGMFRLYSYDTQDETKDLILEWASPVLWISR